MFGYNAQFKRCTMDGAKTLRVQRLSATTGVKIFKSSKFVALKSFVFYSFNLLAGNQFLKLSVFLRQIGKISEIFFPKEMNLKCYPCTLKSINYHPSTGHCQEYIHFD